MMIITSRSKFIKHCSESHSLPDICCPDIEEDELTIDEIRTLYKLLEYQYISYENLEEIEIVRKLSRLIDEHNSK